MIRTLAEIHADRVRLDPPDAPVCDCDPAAGHRCDPPF